MGAAGQLCIFVLAAAASLATSWLLVSRLERLGERLGLAGAFLGLLAALAADSPEITSALTALAHGQRDVGVGVILGATVFNLAAVFGASAIVSGGISLHRRVVLFAGGVATWVAIGCVGTVTGAVSAPIGLLASLAVFLPYVLLLALHRGGLRGRLIPRRWAAWLEGAISEEESEIEPSLDTRRGTGLDAAVALVALAVVVGASVLMERAATDLGTTYSIPDVIVGGVLLAAVTSLPNAVAAIYLASRGRASATLSTALNSNSLNVLIGLLIPAVLMGTATHSGAAALAAWWFLGLTVLALALAYAQGGLRRSAGWLIVAGYAGYVIALFAAT